MIEINEVVATFLACVANEEIRNKINEDNVFKITSLENIQIYLRSSSFKSKKVTADNFEQCLNFALKKLEDDTFRQYLEQNKICFVVFYNREKHSIDNTFYNPIVNNYPELVRLRDKIVNYSVEESILNIQIHPIKLYKEQLIKNTDDIIKLFSETGQPINSVNVSFVYNNEPLGELGEAFLDVGFTLQIKR